MRFPLWSTSTLHCCPVPCPVSVWLRKELFSHMKQYNFCLFPLGWVHGHVTEYWHCFPHALVIFLISRSWGYHRQKMHSCCWCPGAAWACMLLACLLQWCLLKSAQTGMEKCPIMEEEIRLLSLETGRGLSVKVSLRSLRRIQGTSICT